MGFRPLGFLPLPHLYWDPKNREGRSIPLLQIGKLRLREVLCLGSQLGTSRACLNTFVCS